MVAPQTRLHLLVPRSRHVTCVGDRVLAMQLEDVGLLEYQHHPRDYAAHLSPGSIIQPQRRRPSLLSEFQPGNERSQELHLRPESHSYLPELGKSEMDQPGGSEDLAKERSLAGKLEPVSPPSPPHADPELELVPPRLSKEELIQSMDRVDREITMVEQQISKLKKKQPLYNQPSDTRQYHENIKINQAMRKKLILYFKRRNHARKQWEQKFCQRYDQLMEAWEKKVERIENNPRRRAKESKGCRTAGPECVLLAPSRVGQRGSGLSMSAARSEHEVSEIIDGLSEQENLEKQMRQLAVIPPMLYDADQQRIKFINMNGLMDDPMKVYKDRQTVAECVLYYYLTKKNENYKSLVRRSYRRRGKSQEEKEEKEKEAEKEEERPDVENDKEELTKEKTDDTSGEDNDEKEAVASKGRKTANSQGRRKGRITRSMANEANSEEAVTPQQSAELARSRGDALRAAANVRVLLAASMEMNESSRWTEEEMETAKKGEGVGAWPPTLGTRS
ncbi:Nuclear receptor corepressor 2 [Myotis davidii]|uniref:Nuclear receptor corepressor 2 n=1 Tax=Myotis davidii TaxID=225400 RepID=L5LJR9_MYODS|nr:Nuclear receptor corepressor 2 [Myotis davidii]